LYGVGYLDNCGQCIGGPYGEINYDGEYIEELDPCELDCTGEWGGSFLVDQCGECVDTLDPDAWNASCLDCAGYANGPHDLDNCGTCDNDSSNDCVQDCTGIWGGDLVDDECGVCGGPGSTIGCGCDDIPDDYCDCDGNTFDQCGICGGDNSPNTGNCDCEGVPNGEAKEDECGVCNGDNSDMDCNGDCFGGAEVDDCGVCGGDNSSCSDCAGVLNGDAIEDCDGVCNGDNISCFDCAGVPNGDAIEDCTGTCNGPLLGYGWLDLGVDDCGVCGGGYILYSLGYAPDWAIFADALNNGVFYCDCEGNIDLGCGCGEGSDCVDECGVIAGDNSSCVDECGVPNGDNSSCSDCAGFANGPYLLDNCGTCDAIPTNDCVQDCTGEWGGNTMLDCTGICDGDSVYDVCGICNGPGFDECGVCSGGSVGPGTGHMDECGICFGDNSRFHIHPCVQCQVLQTLHYKHRIRQTQGHCKFHIHHILNHHHKYLYNLT
jgi:hypothetical protein